MPFSPAITGTTSAVFTNTGTVKATVGGSGGALRLLNAGTTTAFVAIDTTGTITATTTASMPVLSLATVEVISIKPTGTVYVTGITSSGTTTVYCTRGDWL